MYAFLSKVFGRKKDDRDASSSSQPVLGPGELLGGRFEAVSANVSPSSQCLELDPNVIEVKDKEKEKDKDVGFSFFKGKWRPASPDVKPTRKLDMLPHLSLNFQEPKAEPPTPCLFFTTDQILSDADIGQRRLNPSEALILVQACSRAIIARGLETLGIMHPHWYAASHKIQRRVISHFIYLLNLENVNSTTSLASPTSPLSAFEGEVNDTFSLHDIAAILRWGLRHVQIEGNSFGTDDAWYKTFLQSERAAGYPPKAFSDKLAPLLPPAHLQLLTATLEIFSSLSAHAEVNGTSGSKLCKLFGLWLLTAHRVEDNDDWKTFYARWDQTGRMLEHLFLSRIRDQSTDQRMPIRLLELIHKYPYNQGLPSPTTDLSLLPHPPFTTHLYDTLFVRIEIELPYGKRKPSSKLPPLSLLADAFSTKVEGEHADLWDKITTASKNGDSSFLTSIFTDDTISYLSFVPDESSGHEVKSPTFDLASSSVSPHKPSFPVDDADKSAAFVAEHPKSASELSPLSPLNNGIGSDWTQFSASGFLEVNSNTIPLASTLFDTDIEKTTPPEAVTPLSRKSSKRSKAASPSRKSFDIHRPTSPETKLEGVEEQKDIIKASEPRIIQLDEAFIDFWSDSLLDPISADWPTFIICKFKSSLVPELTFEVAQEGQKKQKTIQWLLLEQVYTIRTPPVAPIVVVRPRPTSPISPSPSLKQRFSFWNVSRTASTSSATSQKGKKKEQELKVGEMGELVEEEPKTEGKELTVRAKSPIFRPKRSLDIAAPKSTEAKRKSLIVKPAEEAKIDEETAAVAAVATGVVVASAAVVITNGLSTVQPNLVEAVTAKGKEDRSAEVPTTEVVSTRSAVKTETVPEPTVKRDDIPLSSTVGPDVVSSSLEANVETVPLESDSLVVEKTAIEPEVVVGEETEGQIEIEPSPATQAVTSSVTDVAPITTEAITEVRDTVDDLEQQEPVAAPLVSEDATTPKPDIVKETPAEHDPTMTAEEAPAVSTSEPETSYTIEGTPAHNILAVSGSPDEDANNQSETIEPRAIEAEQVFSPTEDKTDVADAKTSDSAPVLAAAEQLPEAASQETIQPQSTEVLVAEDVQDDGEITSSTKLEGHDTSENIEAKKDFVVEEAKHDSDPVPEVDNLEHEIETEAVVEPPLLPTSIGQQDLPTTTEHEQETAAHSDEPATIAAEGSSKVVHETDTTGDIELQPELEQGTLLPSAQGKEETRVDAVSSSNDALTAREVETEVEADTHEMGAAATTNDLTATELPQTEQPIMPTIEGDSTKHMVEAAIVGVGLASAVGFSGMEVPEGIHETTLEGGVESVESGTIFNVEPPREHVVDVTTAPETEGTHPYIDSSLRNDPTPVPLALEPESSLVKTELVTERQVEATSTATTNSVPIDAEVQPDPVSSESAPDAQKDIEEVQTQVDGTSEIAQHVEAAADTELEGPPEGVSASSTMESQSTVQLEPEVAPAEEELSAITQVAAENPLPEVENVAGISSAPREIVPIREDATDSIAGAEDQIAPVEVRLEHATGVETSSTDTPADDILPPNVERPETLTPLIEPSHQSPDDEIVGSHAVPKEDVHAPGIEVLGGAALVSIMAAAAVESDLGQGVAENASVHSEELPVNPEPEETVTHEEPVPISSTSLEIPEANVPVTIETEPELRSMNFTTEHEVSTLEVEERHVLLPPENPEAVNESNGESISHAPEPGPEVVEAVVPPVLGTFESQAQDSLEETTEEGHIVEAVSEAEIIVPNEESTVEPLEVQLEIPEARESDLTAGVAPQIISANIGESPTQIEEEKPDLTILQDDTTVSKAVHAEPLETELAPEDPVVVESEPDVLHVDTSIPVVPTQAITVETEVQEDATVTPEAKSDLLHHEIKTEGSSSIEGDVVQSYSPSKNFVDTEVQPEAQVPEETLNTDKADSDVAAANILPEALPSTGLIADPLTSEIVIPEPEIEKEAPAEHDLASTAEESPVVSTSEQETSYTIEVIPAAIDHSVIAESEIHDDENAVRQSEPMELQSEPEPRATETGHTFSPTEDKIDASDDRTRELTAIQQLPEVAPQEMIQPQSTAVLATEDVLDDGENQVGIITPSPNLEGHGTAENIESKREYIVKETKHDSDPIPVLPDDNNLEHKVETETTVKPPLPTSIEQDLPTTLEQEPELDTAHSDELAGIAAVEDPSEVVLDADATGGIELQSELEQETLIPSAQETGVDVVSSSEDALTAVVAHEVETGGGAETQAAAATTDLAAAELPETEQLVTPTTEHLNDAAIVAVGIAAAEGISSLDKGVSEVTHEAMPKGNDSVESETTTPNVELQREHEVDVTASGTEDTHPDINSSLRNDPTPLPLLLEPESSLIKTESVAEDQVEASSTTTTNSVSIDADVQPDSSLRESAPNAQKDIEEVQIQVEDDTSNIKGDSTPELDIVQHIEAADAELGGSLEDVPASTTKESRSTVQLEAEAGLVAPAEEESSTIAQADLSPKIESEAIPIPEDPTASIANVEDQTSALVNIQFEHAAVVESFSTDKPTEVIAPPKLEESPETLTPLVEPSYKSSDDEIVESHVIPEDTQVVGEAAIGSIIAAAAVESELGRGAAEKISVSSQELPANPEPEEPATASIAGSEDQIIAPVDVQSGHPALVETFSTDKPADVILPPSVEENLETLTPLVEPSYKSSDDEIVGSHAVPEEEVQAPGTENFSEAALIMAATDAESDLGRDVTENGSVPAEGLPANPEPEEFVTHEEAIPISSTSLEIPEVDVPVATETEPEPGLTNPTSEDKVSTPGVEGRHVLPSPENLEAVNVESNDESIPLATAEPGPEVVEAVVPPVLGTFETQAQDSVEETTEEGHAVEAFSEAEFIVPNKESTAEPVEMQLEVLEAKESDRTAEVEPQIIPAITEESPTQIEEEKPVLAVLQDDTTVSKAVHAEPVNTEIVPENPVVVESEPDALHEDSSIPVVSTPAIDGDIAGKAQVQEDRLDTTVIPEAELDLPSHEVKTESSSSIKEEDAVQDSSALKGFVDTDVQLEAQELEERFNTDEADSGVAAVNILAEALPSTQGPIVDPLTSSEIDIREPEIEKETPAEQDLTLSAEKSPTVSSSEPETSYTVEVIPVSIDHSPLAESRIHDDENAVNQSETMDLQSELEPRATKVEHNLSPVEDVSKASDSAPILAEQLPEVAPQVVIQSQSTPVLVTENVLDNAENQVETITSSTKLEGYVTADDIEEKKDYIIEEAKHDSDPVPEVNNFGRDVETEATVELPLTTPIEQNLSTTIEQEPELDTAHSNEPAGVAAEGSSKVIFNADATGGFELQSELEQETPIPSPQEREEKKVDAVSSNNDTLTAHGVETEVEADTEGTNGVTTADDLTAEFPETEQPVIPTTGDNSNKLVHEAAIVTVGLAAAEGFSSMEVVPESLHEATPGATDNSVESGIILNAEPQRDVIAPEREDAPDIHSGLRDNLTHVPLPLEPEGSIIETDLVVEPQVETLSPTTNGVPIDVEDQPDQSSSETAPNTQKDIEVQTRVDDTSNIEHEPIPKSDIAQHVEVDDTESALEDAEERHSAITQVAAEDLLPKIESEGAIPQSVGETISIPEDTTAPVDNVEDQIIVPVDLRSEHATVIETSYTDEHAEVILPPNVEESPETLTPLVEPSFKSSDDEIVGSHVVPEDTQVVGEAAIGSIMAAAAVDSDLGRVLTENMSVPSEELPVNPEPEEPVIHEEAIPISSTSLEIPELDVPVTAETEPEPRPTNLASEDKASTLEVEERHLLLSPENSGVVDAESNDESVTVEPSLEVVEAVVAPALGSSEIQTYHSVEEMTEEGHVVEAPSEAEFIVPNEVEPVKVQLEIPESGDRTTEVEPQTIPAIMEESPAQIEDKPVLEALQDDTTLSHAVYAESLDSEHVPEDPAMVFESEPDALYMDTSIPVVPTPAITAAQSPEGLEDRLDSTVIPEAESDFKIKTETALSIEEAVADQPSEAGESDRIVVVEPQIIPAIKEESPAQIEEERPDLAALQDDNTLSEAVHAEPFDTEPPIEDPAMILDSEPDALHINTSIPVVPTPAIAVAAQAPEVQEDRLDTADIQEAESDLPSHEIKTEGSSIEEGGGDPVRNSSPSLESFADIEVQPEAQILDETLDVVEADSSVAALNIPPASKLVDDTNDLLTSASPTAVPGEFIGETSMINSLISEKSAAPLTEENHLQSVEASDESQDSHAIAIDDTQNVILSHDATTERNDVLESTEEEGVPADIYASVNTPISASLGESIDPNFEHNINSGDISKPESELPLSDGDTPVDNPKDNTSITTVELEAGSTHVDEIPLEVVKDKADVAAVSETIEHSYPLASTLDTHIDTEPPNDVSDVADEHERSAKESHLEVINSVQSDPIMSEPIAEPASTVVSSIQDTAAETKVDSIEEVYTEDSTVDQDNTLSTQTEDPAIEQLKKDAPIESIDPAVQEAVVSEEANPEKSSATVKHSHGESEINSLSVDQIVEERIEESLVPPAEIVQEPKTDKVGPELELDAVSAPIADELLSNESPVIDHPTEGPPAEPAANDSAPDKLEILSQTDIMATDETVPIEMQSLDEFKASETHVLNGNGHSTTTQETIGTHGLEAGSVDFATDGDNIQVDPKAIEPIHPTDIPPATLETPSITDGK